MSKRVLALAMCVALLGLIAVDSGRGASGLKPASQRMVKVWFEIKPSEPGVWKWDGKFDQAEFDFYKHRLAAYVKTPLVLRHALDDSVVKELASVKAVPAGDRVQWLSDRLVVDFPGDSAIMTIGLPDDAKHDAATLGDAVGNGLLDEVVNRGRIDKLTRRNALYKRLQQYRNELAQ